MDEGGSEDIDSLHFEISLRGAGRGRFRAPPKENDTTPNKTKGGDGGARAFSGPHQRERYERKPARRSKTEETNPNQRPRKTPARPHPDRRSIQRYEPIPARPKNAPAPLRAMCFQNAMCLYLPNRLHPLAPRCVFLCEFSLKKLNLRVFFRVRACACRLFVYLWALFNLIHISYGKR